MAGARSTTAAASPTSLRLQSLDVSLQDRFQPPGGNVFQSAQGASVRGSVGSCNPDPTQPDNILCSAWDMELRLDYANVKTPPLNLGASSSFNMAETTAALGAGVNIFQLKDQDRYPLWTGGPETSVLLSSFIGPVWGHSPVGARSALRFGESLEGRLHLDNPYVNGFIGLGLTLTTDEPLHESAALQGSPRNAVIFTVTAGGQADKAGQADPRTFDQIAELWMFAGAFATSRGYFRLGSEVVSLPQQRGQAVGPMGIAGVSLIPVHWIRDSIGNTATDPKRSDTIPVALGMLALADGLALMIACPRAMDPHVPDGEKTNRIQFCSNAMVSIPDGILALVSSHWYHDNRRYLQIIVGSVGALVGASIYMASRDNSGAGRSAGDLRVSPGTQLTKDALRSEGTNALFGAGLAVDSSAKLTATGLAALIDWLSAKKNN